MYRRYYRNFFAGVTLFLSIFYFNFIPAHTAHAATLEFTADTTVQLKIGVTQYNFTILSGSEANEIQVNTAGNTLTVDQTAGQSLTLESSDRWSLQNNENIEYFCEVGRSYIIISTTVNVDITPVAPVCDGGGGGPGPGGVPGGEPDPGANPEPDVEPDLEPEPNPDAEPNPDVEPGPDVAPEHGHNNDPLGNEQGPDANNPVGGNQNNDSTENQPHEDNGGSITTSTPELATPTFSPIFEIFPKSVAPVLEKIVQQTVTITEEAARPISIATAPIVAVSSAINAFSLFASGVNLFHYLQYVGQALLVIFGIKKKSPPWGRVFNSKTKEPLQFAKVMMLDKNNRVIDTKITDNEGRYGFLINPESFPGHTPEFSLLVKRNDFVFPARHLDIAGAKILYANIYHGETIMVQKDTAITYDIPLDPTELNMVNAPNKKIPKMTMHNFFVRIADIAFWISIVVVPLTYILDRSLFNLILLIFLIVVNFFRIIGGLREKPYGLVLDRGKQHPMPYALVSLNDETGRRVGFAVSNELGKYILLSKQGEYTVSLATPADVQPPRSYQERIRAKKGWIAKLFHL